ncbi:uncharacterized protein LOC123305702 [Chrysoperla carnea]|uniref:uncharacterized protein LOC123305702 n=1 Tax=Chrysoperla carnea TaxID=189513 RepID=UPI001D073306|nr:uncharacterized protein LOC123305702 [Chrysoperla carnea]
MEKLFVHLIRRSDEYFELAGLSEDKRLWFSLPDEHKNLYEHKVLSSKTTIKSAIAAIKPINGFRKIGIKLDEDLKKEYFDEDGNLSYKNYPLQESVVLFDVSEKLQEENFLIKRIKELELKLNDKDEIKLQNIEKKFVLDKYDKTQNPSEWFSKFESECDRNKIKSGTQMIEALRFFVAGSAKHWYEGNLKKFGLTNWSEWRNSFFSIFIDKGWTAVRKAYTYKYLGGSLIDYALTKENLCLEVESDSTMSSRINLIVMGLPSQVQDELDREDINTIKKLYNELRKLDGQYNKRSKENKPYDNRHEKTKLGESTKKKQIDIPLKKPCYMCEALGWKNRFHPSNECRNKILYAQKKESNLIETKSDSENEAEMMKMEIDRNSLN